MDRLHAHDRRGDATGDAMVAAAAVVIFIEAAVVDSRDVPPWEREHGRHSTGTGDRVAGRFHR